MTEHEIASYDVVVVGSGPAGHSAALQAANAGCSVVIIERDRGVGGACVQRGTIPSKTLRETAAYFAGLRVRTCGALAFEIPPDQQLQSLMGRMEEVVAADSALVSSQLEEHGIEQWHGRARFVSSRELDVQSVRGTTRRVTGRFIVLATGSRPRTPPNVPRGPRARTRQRFAAEHDVLAKVDGHTGSRRDRVRIRLDLREPGRRGHDDRSSSRRDGVPGPGPDDQVHRVLRRTPGVPLSSVAGRSRACIGTVCRRSSPSSTTVKSFARRRCSARWGGWRTSRI